MSGATNANPGPGQYAQHQEKVVPKVQDKMLNSFSTNVSYPQIFDSLFRSRDSVRQRQVLVLCKDHHGKTTLTLELTTKKSNGTRRSI